MATPPTTPGPMNERDAVAAFADALRRRGIVPPARIVPDGKLHRCDAEGGAAGKGDAAYVLHIDGTAAGGFQNHRDGGGWENWSLTAEADFTPEERRAFRTLIARQRREREAEQARRRSEAAEKATALWSAASPAPEDHPYLMRKGVRAHGLRLHKGTLVVPIRNAAGALRSLQFIDATGEKRFLSDGAVAGHFHLIGTPDGGPLLIAEGYATAATLFQATGRPVAVAFDAGNLHPVATAWRAAHPDLPLIVAADDDHRTAGNPGRTKAEAAAAAVGGMLVVPEFGDRRGGKDTDFNDLAACEGMDAVRRCVRHAVTPHPEPPLRVLITTESGGTRACFANAVAFLSGDPIEDRPGWMNPWAGVLAHDEFALRTVLLKPPPWPPLPSDRIPRFWEARDDLFATDWLQHHGCMVGGPKIVAGAVEAVAQRRPFHPVRRYLDGLLWDGVPRIDDWLSDHLGVENTEYARAVGARWLISAVARIFRPGSQADSCLILEGFQGQRKSSALRCLGSPWFTDDLAEVTSKDAAMQTAGVWIIEIAELDAFRGVEITRVKDFLTRRVDRFRPPYGERLIENPRQCVFGATTNALNGYLQDATGARRFWPVRVHGECDLDRLGEARDQLWAEAVHRYRRGDPWWLDTMELCGEAEQVASERFEADAWETLVSAFIARRPDVSIPEVLEGCLDIPKDRWGKAETMRVGRILSALGWMRRQKRTETGRQWRYEPPAVTTSARVSPLPETGGDRNFPAKSNMSPLSPPSPPNART